MKQKVIIITSILVAVVISVCAIGYFGNHFFEFFYEDTPENAIVYDDIYDKYVVYNGRTFKEVQTLEFDISEDEWTYMGEGEYYAHFIRRYNPAYAYPNAESPIIISQEGLGTYVAEDFYSYAAEYNGDFKFSGMRITKTDVSNETEEIRTYTFDKPLGMPDIITGYARYEYERTIGDYIEFSVELISAEDEKIVRKIDTAFTIDEMFFICAYDFFDYDFSIYSDIGFEVNSELIKG